MSYVNAEAEEIHNPVGRGGERREKGYIIRGGVHLPRPTVIEGCFYLVRSHNKLTDKSKFER